MRHVDEATKALKLAAENLDAMIRNDDDPMVRTLADLARDHALRVAQVQATLALVDELSGIGASLTDVERRRR